MHRDARGASRGFERGDSEQDHRARKPGGQVLARPAGPMTVWGGSLDSAVKSAVIT